MKCLANFFRNLPSGKNAFAEVNKDRAHYCRTATSSSQNPEWSEICEVEHPASQVRVRTSNYSVIYDLMTLNIIWINRFSVFMWKPEMRELFFLMR